jgi:hypothetical protein
VFLPPERNEQEGPEFLAFHNAAELHRRIVETRAINPQLRDEHRQDLSAQLHEGQGGGEDPTSIRAVGDAKGQPAIPPPKMSDLLHSEIADTTRAG